MKMTDSLLLPELFKFLWGEPFVRSILLLCLWFPGCWIAWFVLLSWKLMLLFSIGLLCVVRKVADGGSIDEKALNETNLTGQTALVTGGNSGIGKATAIQLAKWGANVIIGCRDSRAGVESVVEIRREAGLASNSARVVARLLDLSDLKSVKAFAESLADKCTEIDILINNAGVMEPPFKKTKQGWETTFGVNILGTFLLTRLLLHQLRCRRGRIVNTTCMSHGLLALQKASATSGSFFDAEEFKRMSNKDAYEAAPKRAHALTKAATILLTRELALRLKMSDDGWTTVCCAHPGVTRTDIRRHKLAQLGLPRRVVTKIMEWLLMKSPDQGAQMQLYLAIAGEALLESGGYYHNMKLGKPLLGPKADSLGQDVYEFCERVLADYIPDE